LEKVFSSIVLYFESGDYMEDREKHCKELISKYFTSSFIQPLVVLLQNAVRSSNTHTKLLRDSLKRRAFGCDLTYAVHVQFIQSIQKGLVPGLEFVPSLAPNSFPDYRYGPISFQPYRLKKHQKFPPRANYRYNRMNSSQALLFSLEELESLGHTIHPETLDKYTYAFLLFSASSENGLTMAQFAFPKSAYEGPGWIIPPFNLLSDTIMVDTDNSYNGEELKLRPNIIKKQGKANA